MQSYDYIVVGSGSAGAVVAGRLSEDPGVSVLVLEAGGKSRPNLNVQIPAAFPKQFKTKLDWEFYTEPEAELNNRRIYHPRGRMLGGCSAMNAMMYVRGNKADYDGWAKAGATGWSYDEVLPLFKRSETNSRGASEYHGGSGPLFHSDPQDINPSSLQLLDGMVESGFERIDDFNGVEQLGASTYQVTQKRGQRWTTYDGYLLANKKRRNLTVTPNAYVHKVVIEGNEAKGVEVKINGELQTIHANREVILSAGSYQSPQLLMLSGIGPAAHLQEHGIDVLVDNEHVGGHLMDHPLYTVNCETTNKHTLYEAEHPSQLLKYFTQRKGLLTSNVGEVGTFFHTRDGDETPYMQMIAGPVYFWDNAQATYDAPVMTIGLSMVGARSEGSVRLGSANPEEKPRVHHNYFSERCDMESMITGIERAREVFGSSAVSKSIVKEVTPGDAHPTRADLEAEIRRNVQHTYHPACTARIGAAGDGVVDADLRVHGIANLRVADASVMPRISSGNTHAPTVLVGEKAADLIKAGVRL